MRSLAVCTLTLATFSLFADLSREERISLLECKMKKVQNETVYPCRNGARFASGRPVTSGYDLSVFGDVLYWKFYEGGNDYSIKNTTVLPSISGRIERLNFDWETGYRIGASYGFSDQWDFTAAFTRIKPDGDDAIEAPSLGELEPMSPQGVAGANGSVETHLKYSLLNFEIGSSYFASHSFYLRPHFGAQGAWIHQKLFTKASLHSINNRFLNFFNGGGLRGGVDSKWFFQKHWNLVVNASASLLYGKFNVSMRNDSTITTSHVGADVHRLVPSFQSLIGLCWETNFAEDCNHLALLLAYENAYWWRQNQLVRFENSLSSPSYGTRLSEDLGAQGLTFNMTLFF